jgi:hypothetical protein
MLSRTPADTNVISKTKKLKVPIVPNRYYNKKYKRIPVCTNTNRMPDLDRTIKSLFA